MSVNLIAAVGRNWKVGREGALPWHDRQDLAWFRKTTMGGIVIVGARTFRAMPALPGREVYSFDGTIAPEEMIKSVKWYARPIWIAGGAFTWRAFAHLVDGLRLINIVDYDGPADALFPADAYGLPGATQ